MCGYGCFMFPETDGHILGLSEKCVKVVELTSRNNEHIVCAAMSACGTWLAYSDSQRLRIFRLNLQLVSYQHMRCELFALRRASFANQSV